jgi:4-hydroxy-tetrahydrodipicolinate synthase
VLDVARLKQQIEFQIASGTTFLVPAGTTGESPTLTHDEHERVISEVVQLASGRCKVMAGTGSNCTAEALRLTRWAAKAGADASLQVAPYYNKPTQRGFYEHFKAIAEDVGIPHCVYNIPGRSAKNIEPETIAKLAELKNITMVKEATGSLDQCSQILNTTNLTVLSGDDSLTLPMMSIGAQGVISVAGNIVPGDLLAMVKAALAGDFALASKLHHRLFPLCRDMLSLATNPIPVKGAMKLLGRDTGELRLPMTELEPKEFDALRATLLKYGILK